MTQKGKEFLQAVDDMIAACKRVEQAEKAFKDQEVERWMEEVRTHKHLMEKLNKETEKEYDEAKEREAELKDIEARR